MPTAPAATRRRQRTRPGWRGRERRRPGRARRGKRRRRRCLRAHPTGRAPGGTRPRPPARLRRQTPVSARPGRPGPGRAGGRRSTRTGARRNCRRGSRSPAPYAGPTEGRNARLRSARLIRPPEKGETVHHPSRSSRRGRAALLPGRQRGSRRNTARAGEGGTRGMCGCAGAWVCECVGSNTRRIYCGREWSIAKEERRRKKG